MTADPLRREVRLTRPLDLLTTLAPLRRGGRSDPTFRFEDGRTVWRATRNADGAVTVAFENAGDRVVVRAWGPGAALALEAAPATIGENDDLAGFAPPRGSIVAELHHRHPGLRLCRGGALVEALVPTVMEQKVIGEEARAGYRRLVWALGEPAPGPAGLRVPPPPEELARTPYWRFHPFAVERRRAETIQRACGRAPRLEALLALPPAEARERLAALPGLGPWSAAEITSVAMGDADAVPVGDYNLPNVVCHALAGMARGDDATMLELLEPYRGHRGRVIRLLVRGAPRPPRFGPRLAMRHMERH